MTTINLQTPNGYPFHIYDDERPTREQITQTIARLSSPDFHFRYSEWRHGGSYTNVRYPSGACGCIASARHTISKRFEIACDARDSRPTFKTREAAANAERLLVLEMWQTLL